MYFKRGNDFTEIPSRPLYVANIPLCITYACTLSPRLYLLLRRLNGRVFLTDILGNEQHLSEYLLEHLVLYQHDPLLSVKYV